MRQRTIPVSVRLTESELAQALAWVRSHGVEPRSRSELVRMIVSAGLATTQGCPRESALDAYRAFDATLTRTEPAPLDASLHEDIKELLS